MTNSMEKLRHELQAAQRALAEAQAQQENREATYRLTTLDLEENRSALLFMLEDLDAGRRKIEQAHREWITALDAVKDPIFLHDKQFCILRCNKAYRQRAGLPFKQIIGRPYYEIFPKTGAPLPGCLQVMEKTGAATDVEEMVVGGTTYRSRTFSVYDEQGNYLHSAHILEDITEHKRAEAVLQQSQERLRNIIDGLGPNMFVGLLTTEGVVLEANQQALAAAGLKPEDVLGKPVEEAYWFSYSEESKRQMCESVARAARGEASRYDVQIRVAEDQYIPLDFSLQPFRDATGKVVLLVPSAIVITERKRAETLLGGQKQVLEMIAVGVPLPEVLTALVRLIEAQSPGMLGTILLLDEDGVHIRHGAAPSLPAEFVAALDGQPIGPCAGSCGTAAYRKEPVFVEDIATDPLWEAYKAALPHGLRACWATPIFDVQRRVLGTFAMYFRQPGLPQPEHLRLIDIATQTASIAISHHRGGEALRKSEARTRSVFEQANDGIYIISADNRYLDANARGLELLGYTREELLQMGVADVLAAHEVARLAVEQPEMMSGVPHLAEWAYVRKDGSIFPGEVSARRLDDHSYLAIVRDLTERRRAEAALRASEAKFRAIIESSPVSMAVNDVHQNITFLNRKFIETFGYTLADIPTLAEWWPRAYPDPAYRQRVAHEWQAAMEKAQRDRTELEPMEYKVTCKGGTVRDIRFSMAPIGASSLVIFYDITERKQAEAALRESEEKLRLFVHHAPSAIAMFDRDMCYVAFSHRWLADYGLGEQELAGRSHYEVFPELPERWKEVHRRGMAGAIEKCDEDPFPRADGQVDWVRWEVHPWRTSGGNIGGIIIFSEVITGRKQAEVAIQHANRALAALSVVNRNLVHATDENELLQAICDAIVKQKGYRMSWVGYVQHDESKSIKIMARTGHDEGYLDTAQISWAESEHGMGSSGRAVRSGATQLCQDIASDPYYSPWREAALKRGYAASIGLPLLEADGTVFGILNVYAAEANAFTLNEVDLLEEMAGDMAFGVRSLHTRHERDLAQDKIQQQLVQLRDSLEDTVRAIATIVEMRDPYTAGHQVRVADLAAMIAKQLGLPEEQVHAIHLAGIVHDLGKIKIPAEILSKPGKITDLEFRLIKVHPQAGYDILKGISFPWPIAQIVLQHHERMDGSGYPQGLKGDAILLEARILSVADVVEAISAHRPYRAGLGVEVALGEITKNRGIFYDPQVVDACLAVFNEQHYSFKS